jgi:hypothetical protein
VPIDAADEREPIAHDDLETARARPYPLVTVTTRTEGTMIRSLEEAVPSRTLVLESVTNGEDDAANLAAAAARLLAAAQAGARVVWIRNTVREAQCAFRALAANREEVELTLFHARFRGCDRRSIEESVLKRFGKAAPPGGRVLIATQVVEQSLDIDFDEMHTDLAPIDLLLQRAGRLHRHDRVRPPGFESPRLVVHGPSDADIAALRFGPSRFVYDAGTLWIAARALRSRGTLDLPADIRPLVEESYHPASRAALLSLGGKVLVALEVKREGELEAKRTKAKQCCIPPTTADPDGGAACDDDDDAVQAFTRDGISATLLPFWWNEDGARALDANHSSAVWRLDAACGDAWRLAGELLDQTLSLPARKEVAGVVGSAEGLAWEAWRKRFVRFAEDSGLGSRVVPLPMRRDAGLADRYKGWLRMGGKRRRVLYSPTVGLLIPSEQNEEQAR